MYYNQDSHKFIIACVIAFIGLCVTATIYTYSDRKTNRPQCIELQRIGVLDTIRLKKEATCFNAHDEIAKKINATINANNEITEKIRNDADCIKKNKKLSQEEKKYRLTTLELKWEKFLKETKDEMKDLQNLETKLTEYIQNKIIKIIGDIAKMNKIDIVLNKETKDSIFIFYHKKNMDITDSVINKLNQVIPTVKLKELEND